MAQATDISAYEDPARTRMRRYVVVALSLAVVAIVSAAFVMYEHQGGEQSKIIAEFHMVAAHSAQSAMRELAGLEYELRDAAGQQRGSAAEQAGRGGIVSLAGSSQDRLYRLSDIRQHLVGLQQSFKRQGLQEIFELTDRAFADLIEHKSLPIPRAKGMNALDAVATLRLRLEQFERMHLVATEQLIGEGPFHEAGEIFLLFLFTVLLGSASFMTVDIVRRMEIASIERGEAMARAQQASGKLSKTTDRLATAQKIAKIGNWEWEPETDELTWSDEAYRISGLEAGSAVTNEAFLSMLLPADRESVRSHMRDAIDNGTPYTTEYHLQQPGGEIRTIMEHGEIGADDVTERRFLRGTMQDITERKRIGQALRDSEELFRGVFDQAAVGILLTEADGRFRRANPKVCEILGYGEEDLLGMTYRDFTHPDDLEATEVAHAELRAGEVRSVPMEKRYIRNDGTVVWVRATISYMRDEEGNHLGNIALIEDIGDRKKAEQALADTVHSLAEAQRIGQIGSWELDVESGVLTWSKERFRLLGLDPDSAAPTFDELLELIHPDDRDALVARNERAVTEGVLEPIEYRIVRPDGSTQLTQSRGEVVYDEDGNVRSLRGTVQDITERKRIEQALRESEELFRGVFDQAAVGIAWAGPDGRLAKTNRRLSEILRYPREELEALRFQDITHPDDLEANLDYHRRLLAGKIPFYTMEKRYIRGDSTIVWGSVTISLVRHEDGTPKYMIAVLEDINERKRIEQALRESEARLDAFFTEAPAGLAIIDSDYRYVHINETLARMNGLPVDDHIGKRPSDFLPRELAEMIEGSLQRTLERGEAIDHEELGAPGPDGRMGYWVFSQFPISGDPKKPDAIGAVVVDITELKTAQGELASLNAKLEQHVEERTAELRGAQADLVKSERLATLGQLTATVSHELRNPLGAMRASMYVVEKRLEGRDDRATSAIERVNRSITRCDHIIDELLDYTRIRHLEIQPTAIDPWLGGILDEQPVPEGVKIRQKLGAPGLRVPADADRLRRAVINIYENACQALTVQWQGPDSGGKKLVSIETRIRGDRLEIVFSDTGPGIPDDLLDKVFEPLFSTKNFGVGLGLPTVHQIMQQHGGGVIVSPRRGGGVKFALWLPLTREMETAGP